MKRNLLSEDERRAFLETFAPNMEMAQRFLQRIGQGPFTFQTFRDKKSSTKVDTLAHVIHGHLDEHLPALHNLNACGAGIYVMINEGDGKVHAGRKTCRTTDSVIRVRANFVDLDGAPLAPLLECRAPPDLIVESSPGKYHGYWLGIECPLDAFRATQLALALKFGGDRTVCDLPRVMRLPGFFHRKGEPFTARIIKP